MTEPGITPAQPGSGGTAVSNRPAASGSAAPSLGAVLNQAAHRFALIGVWGLLILVYSLTEPKDFLRVGTFQTIFNSQGTLVFLVLALLCTITVGEFVDLSIASNLGLAAIMVPVLAVNHGWNVWAASLAAVLVSAVVGVVNGILVVYCGINTIVVTLGMGTFLTGIGLWISNLALVSGLSSGFGQIALYSWWGLPAWFWYGIVAVALFAYLLGYTPLGTHIRFVGASHEVSRLAGIRVNRVRFGAFTMGGVFCGIGGVLTAAALGGFDPTVSATYLLPAFAATFLGTAVIQPGIFNPVGSWIGVYFLSTGVLGLQLLTGSGWVADVFYGGVLVAAVAISTLLSRRAGARAG
jgi:ribose transport system permease protein